MLVLVLALVACAPEEAPAGGCPVSTDAWIELPEEVSIKARDGSGSYVDAFRADGLGEVCAVVCTPWEAVGMTLHEPDGMAIAEGEWEPSDVASWHPELPTDLWFYAAPASVAGDVSTCEITSSAGVDFVDVVAVER